MEKPPLLLSKSFSFLNSFLMVVLFAYLLDVIYARMIYLKMGFLAVLVTVPAKIYLFSGLYGALVEIVSGEEMVFKLKRLKYNAREFWKIYLILASIPFILQFVFMLTPLKGYNISPYAFYAHCNIFILYAMARYILDKKYLRPLKLQKAKDSFDIKELGTLSMLGAVSMVFFYIPYIWDPKIYDITRITLLGFNYFNLVMFIYIALGLLKKYPQIEKNFTYEKEIYLINPLGGSLVFYLGAIFWNKYTPAFVVLKALSPKYYKFREFNQCPWHARYYAGNKLVAITCFTSNSSDCYRIASEFRKRGSKVVLGGPHVTFVPEEALEYCDSVVVGEMESVWADVIKDYENNSLKRKYTGVPVAECHDLIHKELLNSPPEIIKDFLETSRGCKFKCHFCTVPAISGGKVRTKRIFDVVELIDKIKHEYKYINFIDNNIYSDPAYAKELFKALKPLNVKWFTQCTIDIVKNDEILKLAKESGCAGFLIGFEISETSLAKQEGGKLAMAAKYKEYAKKLKDLGIKIKAHFIFGFEQDTFRQIWDLWKFCFSINPFATVPSILTPFPGSKVYDDMIKEDCISNLNWKYYGCQSLVFKHKRMNNFILAKAWPAIFLFLFLTTSKLGYIFLALIIMNIAGIF